MPRTFSAYLSIFNDWDILLPALRSVAGHIQELVVVDGAYEWMVPYLSILGVDPRKSKQPVYDALEASGIPYRVITGTWKNEIEKRIAGYQACTTRYIYRVDADEVISFDDAELERMLSSGAAVAGMSMPTYIAPGWIKGGRSEASLPQQCFLFDREQVDANAHLNHLWLILTVDQRPEEGQPLARMHPHPVAFNAHLTEWRTPTTSVNRAAFYTMNWMRQHGAPWIPELWDKPVTDFTEVFTHFSPAAFLEFLRQGPIVMSGTLSPEEILKPSPLDAAGEAPLLPLYSQYLNALAAQTMEMTRRDWVMFRGHSHFIDLTSAAVRAAVAPGGLITFEAGGQVADARIRHHRLATTAPQTEATDLPREIADRRVSCRLPAPPAAEHGVLRELIELSFWTHDDELVQHYRISI